MQLIASFLFYTLAVLLLFVSILIVLVGSAYVLNTEIDVMFGINIAERIKDGRKK